MTNYEIAGVSRVETFNVWPSVWRAAPALQAISRFGSILAVCRGCRLRAQVDTSRRDKEENGPHARNHPNP